MSMQKTNLTFKSGNNKNTIHAYVYTDSEAAPRAVLQISHGMCEFIARYEHFAAFLTSNGIAVCGNDHLGHGETSDDGGIDGFFDNKDGDKYVLQDLNTLTQLVKKQFPGLPYILLGHSMGSFFARQYAIQYPNDIDALIISGTGGPNPLSGVGLFLAEIIAKIKGSQYRSTLIDNMAFGAYCKKYPEAQTKYDWVTSNKAILDEYVANPKCTFIFTAGAFKDMLKVNRSVNKKCWGEKLRKDLPILIFSGDMDPVGDYGKGVKKVYEFVKSAQVKDVTLKLYQNGRHEMLNETTREQVYNDVLSWIKARFNI